MLTLAIIYCVHTFAGLKSQRSQRSRNRQKGVDLFDIFDLFDVFDYFKSRIVKFLNACEEVFYFILYLKR